MERSRGEPPLRGGELVTASSACEALAVLIRETQLEILESPRGARRLTLVTMSLHARLVDRLRRYEPGDWLETLTAIPPNVISMTIDYLVRYAPFNPDELTVLIEHHGMGTAVDYEEGMPLSSEAALLLERGAMYQDWLIADLALSAVAGEPGAAERTVRVSAVLGWLLTKLSR